jgi:hypothetical protein
LSVKGGARPARWRPGGRLRPLTACAAPWAAVAGNTARSPEFVMNDKSFVSMEQHVCLVCGTAFDTGSILLHKRLHPTLNRHTTTGWGLCPEHQKLFDDGYVALIECDPQRSDSPTSDHIKPEQAYRTGRLAHLRRTVFTRMFNVPISDEQACVFVEPGVIEKLESMTTPTPAAN